MADLEEIIPIEREKSKKLKQTVYDISFGDSNSKQDRASQKQESEVKKVS